MNKDDLINLLQTNGFQVVKAERTGNDNKVQRRRGYRSI